MQQQHCIGDQGTRSLHGYWYCPLFYVKHHTTKQWCQLLYYNFYIKKHHLFISNAHNKNKIVKFQSNNGKKKHNLPLALQNWFTASTKSRSKKPHHLLCKGLSLHYTSHQLNSSLKGVLEPHAAVSQSEWADAGETNVPATVGNKIQSKRLIMTDIMQLYALYLTPLEQR